MTDHPATTTPYLSAWTSLSSETQDGTWERRLDPRLPLYATLINPSGIAGLELRCSDAVEVDPSELRDSEQFMIRVSAGTPGTLTLEAKSQEAVEIFVRMADDLVALARTREDEAAAARSLIRRFNTWQRFLKESSSGLLSQTRQIGLVGELITLRDLIVPSVGPAVGVAAWTGPDRAPQDFQMTQLAVEVKTVVHSEPQILRIDGERQLDDFGLEVLVVAHHRVFVHKGSGQTLLELVAEIREQLAESSTALEQFDDKLFSYGYAETEATQQAYSTRGYSLKATAYYRVRGGAFPRITETDLHPGLGQVEYSIAAAVCEPFMVTEAQLVGWLRTPEPAVDPSTAVESQEVEYKQSTWAPTKDPAEGGDVAQISKEIQNGVIKTVVAFMNSDGGELVIGVRDHDRSVAGIEADLAFRKLDAGDTDSYELQLRRLLADRIDELAHRQTRITFVASAQGTTCHVAVTPSPNPRFGRPFPKPNTQPRPVFWVRSGNATVELEGRSMIDYIADQWF